MPSHDVMPEMDLFQPLQIEDALALADRLGDRAWLLGGGQDTYGWLKDRAKTAEAMIDLNGIESLRGVRETADGIEIGALTTLTDVANNALVKEHYSLLSAAASRVASPQIRNAGTLGGNVSQDVRCWYYRRGLDCYRAGGNLCYADTPQGMNREHAIFGASRCVAVNPSDTAPALVALEATMVIKSLGGQRVINAEDYFVGPANDILNTTALREGEILSSIRIPAKWADATFYFEKVADRNVWDFALVSMAVAMKMSGETIEDSRFVAGAVECKPRRLTDIENAVQGRARDAATAESIGTLASNGARILAHNQYKVPLIDNLVKRAIAPA